MRRSRRWRGCGLRRCGRPWGYGWQRRGRRRRGMRFCRRNESHSDGAGRRVTGPRPLGDLGAVTGRPGHRRPDARHEFSDPVARRLPEDEDQCCARNQEQRQQPPGAQPPRSLRRECNGLDRALARPEPAARRHGRSGRRVSVAARRSEGNRSFRLAWPVTCWPGQGLDSARPICHSPHCSDRYWRKSRNDVPSNLASSTRIPINGTSTMTKTSSRASKA